MTPLAFEVSERRGNLFLMVTPKKHSRARVSMETQYLTWRGVVRIPEQVKLVHRNQSHAAIFSFTGEALT